MPVAQYSITADETYAGLDKILNDEVIPQLNQVDGIGNISLSGAPDRYIYIDIRHSSWYCTVQGGDGMKNDELSDAIETGLMVRFDEIYPEKRDRHILTFLTKRVPRLRRIAVRHPSPEIEFK